jgi:hypothetical protein
MGSGGGWGRGAQKKAVILSGAEALRSAVEGPLTSGGGEGGGLVGEETTNVE